MVGLAAGLAWVLYGRESVEQAQISEMRTHLASIEISQKIFFREYGRYGETFQEIGYTPEGGARAQLYMTTESVPEDYHKVLASEDLPFVEKYRYQVLGVFRSAASGEICFFTKRSAEDIHKVKCVPSP